jgi:hypothetical protein
MYREGKKQVRAVSPSRASKHKKMAELGIQSTKSTTKIISSTYQLSYDFMDVDSTYNTQTKSGKKNTIGTRN